MLNLAPALLAVFQQAEELSSVVCLRGLDAIDKDEVPRAPHTKNSINFAWRTLSNVMSNRMPAAAVPIPKFIA